MTGSPSDPETASGRSQVRRRPTLRVISWLLSGLTFVVGPLIGMTIDAEAGAAIWILSAVLALLPFATHRSLDTR